MWKGRMKDYIYIYIYINNKNDKVCVDWSGWKPIKLAALSTMIICGSASDIVSFTYYVCMYVCMYICICIVMNYYVKNFIL